MKKGWKPAMCECGRGPKEYGPYTSRGHRRLVGCRYCNDLDGKSVVDRDVISLIRSVSGGVSVDAVAGELERKYNTAQVQLLRMVKRGRLRAVPDVADEPWNPSASVEYYLAPIHARGCK